MNLTFSIHYQTNWGQVMMITGSLPQLGNFDETKAIRLETNEDGYWEHSLVLDDLKEPFEYKYFLFDENSGVKFHEWGKSRIFIPLGEKVEQTRLTDHWRNATRPENALFTSAFSNAIFRRKGKKKAFRSLPKKKGSKIMRLQLLNSRVEEGHEVAVVGELDTLGKWNFERAIEMSGAGFPLWTTEFYVPEKVDGFSYKYCIVDKKTGAIVLDEAQDRYFHFNNKREHSCNTDDFFMYPRTPWKGAGVAIPVFSIRSEKGFGVGEFLDLKLLVDWAKRTGLKMIQILPINDTVALHNWVDSYPYAAISVFALHPIYLRLDALGKLPAQLTEEIFEERRRILNSKGKVDYEAVMRSKARFIKQIYDTNRSDFLASTEFKLFFEDNKEWLKPYAAFSYLRDLFGSPRFKEWGRFRNYTKQLVDEITDPSAPQYDDIAVHYYQQYHLHKQLLEAAEYARENQVVLKGDIPIGIYRNSVDAWVAPNLYNMSSQAGAPPDDFAEQGQNWRFPTYNWDEMAKDDYSWWRKRLKKMALYFDAYRIDHILGFFRIWEIPEDQRQGIMGRFNPAWALHRNEIAERGIDFDYLRYCRPYIREHMLQPLFGDDVEMVKSEFLVEYQPFCFYLKPEFDTQVKVDRYFKVGPEASPAEKSNKEKLRIGLNYLISEVLFFEVPFSDGAAFHPRHSMFKTWSFQELSGNTQRCLMELYNEYFYRRNEDFWRQKAMEKLPPIKSATDMLVCGEDLGMVPKCVPDVMNDLGILSLEVQRMPKDPRQEFGHPSHYPYLSVATPSSHDTSTIRGWWEEDSSRSQRFYNEILGKDGGSPFYCEPWVVKDIIVQHIYSPSMWAVFPIQDFLGMNAELRLQNAMDERINEPANPTHYWRYRFHMSIEELLKNEDLNDLILNMMKESGRYWAY